MSPHIKYLCYVARHKWFVFRAGTKTGASLWRLLKHDCSKFTPIEWFPYVRYFYGDRDQYRLNERCAKAAGYISGKWVAEVEGDFDRAWLHHQHANDHHWQHWVLRNDDGTTRALEIPDACVREMVADWLGAGRAITGEWDCWSWYAENADLMVLNDRTRVKVEAILAVLDKSVFLEAEAA